MRKALGYLLMGLGFLILWPFQILLVLSGLVYIVTTFLNAGVVAGLISIPIVAVILGVVHLVIFALTMPYTALVASLLEEKKPSQYERIRDFYEEEWKLASPEKRAELEWRNRHWYRYMEDGLSPREADAKARRLNYAFWSGMKQEDENS